MLCLQFVTLTDTIHRVGQDFKFVRSSRNLQQEGSNKLSVLNSTEHLTKPISVYYLIQFTLSFGTINQDFYSKLRT